MESPKRTSICGIAAIGQAHDKNYIVCACGWTFRLDKPSTPDPLIREYLKHNPNSDIMADQDKTPTQETPKSQTVLRLTFKLSPRSKAIELTPEQARELQRQLNQVLGVLKEV